MAKLGSQFHSEIHTLGKSMHIYSDIGSRSLSRVHRPLSFLFHDAALVNPHLRRMSAPQTFDNYVKVSTTHHRLTAFQADSQAPTKTKDFVVEVCPLYFRCAPSIHKDAKEQIYTTPPP